MLNRRQSKCPLCRADFSASVPKAILDEVIYEDDTGYDSTDEIDERATHIKIRYDNRDIAFVPNDGMKRQIYYDDGHSPFRIEIRQRRVYLFRTDDDTSHPVYPLHPICSRV
jgi:hypothetical protein